MNNKTYLLVVSVVFSLVTLLHLCRIVGGWEVAFNGYALPMWISWVGLVVGGLLAVSGFQAYRKS